MITRSIARRIWGEEEGYRLFLSHKNAVKRKASLLKERLFSFGISAFVAHADIHPTERWQDEIENALDSMDAFVALLSKSFHDSDWTDQEVGFALGRRVPLIAVKLGRDPYGFIGRFQALTCDWDEAPLKLARLLVKRPRMLNAFIQAVPNCGSFDEGNTLSKLLPHIQALTERQADELARAFNGNSQLRGSYGFNGEKPYRYGEGLAAHLSRATGRKYFYTSSGTIRRRTW